MRRAAWPLLFLLTYAPTAAADAGAVVAVTLEPWAAFDGVDRPHRYVVTMSSTRAVEVVADRRLLSFEVRPEGSRRPQRCRHGGAPARVSAGRVRALAPGEVWREWIDLRMYCWGRALAALEQGGEVRARYGFGRPTSARWVGRVPESHRRTWTGGVDVEPFQFPAIATPQAAPGEAPAARVSLAAVSARTGRSIRFRVAVRAVEGRRRVYVRPDAFSFSVLGPGSPTDSVRCELEGGGSPTPPPDLYRRISERIAWRELLDASVFCPPETFERAGVYEVTPEITLEHGGEEWNFDAVTGTFRGPPAPLRITAGGEGYVEQIPQRSEGGDD